MKKLVSLLLADDEVDVEDRFLTAAACRSPGGPASAFMPMILMQVITALSQ